MDTGNIKHTLRRRMADARDRLTDAQRRQGADSVCQRVMSLPLFHIAKTVLTYMAIGSELQTNRLVEQILHAGKQLVVPRVSGDQLTLHPITDPTTELLPGRWNIPEPAAHAPSIPAMEIDLFLLPGLAFDAAGGRLGYGRGFFDRALAETDGATVGLAYNSQIINTVPTETWDVPMDYIITPDRVIQCGRHAI